MTRTQISMSGVQAQILGSSLRSGLNVTALTLPLGSAEMTEPAGCPVAGSHGW